MTASFSSNPAGQRGGVMSITRDAKPQQRLDADAIGRGRRAEGAEAGDEFQEFAA